MLIYFHETKFSRLFAPDAPPAPWRGDGGCGGGLSHASHDSHGSSVSMRRRRVNAHDGSCFCGLKTVTKKSGIAENPNRLFHACPRYRKGSHCNYFKWVDDDEFEAVGVCGTKKDAGADMEVEGEYDEWRVKVAWKLGTLEAEVRALKLLMILLFVTQGSSTPFVNVPSNTRKLCLNVTRATPDSELQIVEFQQQTRSQPLEVPPLALSLPSSVQEELIKDDFIYVPPQEETQQTSNNDCPQEAEKQGVTVSLTSSVIEDLFKDDYVYEPCKRTTATSPRTTGATAIRARNLWNSNNSPAKKQQRNNPNKKHLLIYPPEPKNQGVMWSLTSSDADVYQVSDEEQLQEPPVAQQSEKETLILSSFDRNIFRTNLTSSSSLQNAAEKDKITNELIEKCYHWMTHVEQTKEGSNEYEPVFVLKHEGLYEGLREYFMSLIPKEHVHAVVVRIHSMILNEIKTKRYQEQIYIVSLDIVYTDKRTNKAYRFDIEQYAHHRQFLDKRKLASSHPFLFVPICNGGHWWLWIANVNKKKLYVLDPINKKPEDIPDSRKELNKFVMRVYAGTEPLMENGMGKEAEYIQLNGQRTEYQYGPNLLLHKMNKIRDQVISKSEAIRLTKPSAFLSSPYCKYTSGDLDSK
ncbi:hypothetical protein Ahy_B03g065592 [Arachis hypogaea]|uniref:GRF-type domain-containing protein n=1 Tax=Arachis hypogaea TaxID=3818 RepID=A0A445A1Z1_ARAHY|nr:hypothetical protein Ahy_B03g065592 [Arachis hypogaea]